MKICQIYCGVFGGWGWEHVRQDGSVEESRDVFESRDECVQDASRHGYAAERVAQIQPQNTPLVTAQPRAETKAVIAA